MRVATANIRHGRPEGAGPGSRSPGRHPRADVERTCSPSRRSTGAMRRAGGVDQVTAIAEATGPRSDSGSALEHDGGEYGVALAWSGSSPRRSVRLPGGGEQRSPCWLCSPGRVRVDLRRVGGRFHLSTPISGSRSPSSGGRSGRSTSGGGSTGAAARRPEPGGSGRRLGAGRGRVRRWRRRAPPIRRVATDPPDRLGAGAVRDRALLGGARRDLQRSPSAGRDGRARTAPGRSEPTWTPTVGFPSLAAAIERRSGRGEDAPDGTGTRRAGRPRRTRATPTGRRSNCSSPPGTTRGPARRGPDPLSRPAWRSLAAAIASMEDGWPW